MSDDGSWHGFSFEPGPIAVEGAVFDDFLLTDHLPADQAPGVIERDRLLMAARPGFNRKLLPLRLEPDSGRAYSGGRYLLDTHENAVEFARWVKEDFAIDGTLLLERPDFAEVTAQVWRVIGAHDFARLADAQKVVRVERWTTAPGAESWLENNWPTWRDRAEEAGLASVWLVHNGEQREASLVMVNDAPTPAAEPDFTSVAALENLPSLATDAEAAGLLTRVFDRTSWIFTIWLPYRDGADNAPAIWPNSPPLPAPDTAVDSAA
ncbi:MAG: hypothetical protein QNJ73_17260 [Gammaproteobacteria bacterium]|nr:hypothetical protein [Gammaproteobacteria bacterium]